MSGTLSQSQGTAAALPISAGYYPTEGSRALTAQYSWRGSNRQYNEDLSMLQADGLMQPIQGIFVDNSLVAFPIVIQIRGTNQRITVPAGAVGVFPVYFSNGARYSIAGISSSGELVFTGANDNTTTLIWLNIPINSAMLWYASGLPSGLMENDGLTYTAVADGAYCNCINKSYGNPTDARFFVQSCVVGLSWTTPPTSAGTMAVQLVDAGLATFAVQRSFWATGQVGTVLNFTNLNYMFQSVGEALYVHPLGFPPGAAGLTVDIWTTFTFVPLIIGS